MICIVSGKTGNPCGVWRPVSRGGTDAHSIHSLKRNSILLFLLCYLISLMTVRKLRATSNAFSWRAVYAEFVALTLFVYIGCGTAMFFLAPAGFDYSVNKVVGLNITTNAAWGMIVPLTFGFAITALVFVFGHVSGGHINSAVSWGLFLAGKLSGLQLVGNTLAQFAGSVLGAGLLYGTLPDPTATSLGANAVSDGAYPGNAVLGEIVMTFVLVFTVLMSTSKEAKGSVGQLAPFAIGFAVFLGHAVLLPLDGCSINPSRSFGPALIANKWSNFWVFIVGPYVGSSFAAAFYWTFHYSERKAVREGLQQVTLADVINSDTKDLNASNDTLADVELANRKEGQF